MKQEIKNIDREATLQVAKAWEKCLWFRGNFYGNHELSTEGNVFKSSLVVDGFSDPIVKITRQYPLDFYIDMDGNRVETIAPTVDQFSLVTYNTDNDLKTIYKVVEVAKDIPFTFDEFMDEIF